MNWKERWNHITDPLDDWDRSKIFSKEWCISTLFLVCVLAVIIVIAILCSYFNVDIESLSEFFIVGIVCFVAGVVFGIDRAEKMQRELKKQKQFEDALKILREWAREKPDIRTVYMYGSRAKKDSKKSSDLDIALEIEPKQDTISSHSYWTTHGGEFEQELQALLPYKVHLEYYSQVKKELVKDIVRTAIDIEKTGIVIYSKTEDQEDE